MGKHNRSTSRSITSRVVLMGGTAVVAGAMTLAGAGTASAASFHLFGHHSQKHAEHKLGISGSPGNTASGTDSQAKGNDSHTTGAKTSATHQATKAKVSAEHHVGKAGSTTH